MVANPGLSKETLIRLYHKASATRLDLVNDGGGVVVRERSETEQIAEEATALGSNTRGHRILGVEFAQLGDRARRYWRSVQIVLHAPAPVLGIDTNVVVGVDDQAKDVALVVEAEGKADVADIVFEDGPLCGSGLGVVGIARVNDALAHALGEPAFLGLCVQR